MKKNKILFVSHCFPLSSHDHRGTFFSDILNELSVLKIEVGVLAPRWEAHQKLDWDFEDLTFELRRPFLSQRQFVLKKLNTLLIFYWKIVYFLIFKNSEIKKYNKIVFCWGFPSGILASLFNRKSKKIVWWLGTDFQLFKKYMRTMLFVIGRQTQHASCSLYMRSQMQELSLPHVKHLPISYGLTDLKPLKKNKSRNKKLKFIAVGRLEQVKQFDKLIECFKQLEPEYFSLTIVGDGQLSGELEELAKHHENVSLTGRLSKTETLLAMHSSDFLIVCSKHEGLPTVFFEGLSVGTPCISLDVGDIGYLNREYSNVCYIMKDLSPEEILAGHRKFLLTKQSDFERDAKLILERYEFQTTVKELAYE